MAVLSGTPLPKFDIGTLCGSHQHSVRQKLWGNYAGGDGDMGHPYVHREEVSFGTAPAQDPSSYDMSPGTTECVRVEEILRLWRSLEVTGIEGLNRLVCNRLLPHTLSLQFAVMFKELIQTSVGDTSKLLGASRCGVWPQRLAGV